MITIKTVGSTVVIIYALRSIVGVIRSTGTIVTFVKTLPRIVITVKTVGSTVVIV